jgi:hypothetical protein
MSFIYFFFVSPLFTTDIDLVFGKCSEAAPNGSLTPPPLILNEAARLFRELGSFPPSGIDEAVFEDSFVLSEIELDSVATVTGEEDPWFLSCSIRSFSRMLPWRLNVDF